MFVVKGNCMRHKRIKGILDVNLRATCNADAKGRDAKANEVLHKVEDLFASRWKSSGDRTFV